MKNVVQSLALALLLCVTAPQAPAADGSARSSDNVVRWHFAGFDQLAQGANATTLQTIWKLPETVDFREASLGRIAGALAAAFSPQAGQAPAGLTNLIRPLLDDLWRSESYFECREAADRKREWFLAIHLNEERRQVWQNNCTQLRSGWTFKSGDSTAPISFAVAKSWFVIGGLQPVTGSPNPINRLPAFQKIEQQGRPIAEAKDYWLNAHLDRIADLLPALKQFGLASGEVQVSPRRENLRTEVRLRYAKPKDWRLDAWSVPTNTIRDPLISFTAVQGIGPWLKKQSVSQELQLPSAPNQIFSWSQALKVPLQIFAAAPMPDAAAVLRRFQSSTMPRLNARLKHDGVGEIQPVTNQTRVVWQGLPILVPSVRAVEERAGEFLLADIFPLDQTPYTNPPPAALFQQLTSRTNLVYYDWEITEPRLLQIRPLMNLLSIVLTVPPQNTNALSSKWLDGIQSRLGEAITEASVLSPTEINIVRRSHIGLTSLELLAFAHWLESTNFPRATFRLGFQEPVKQRKGASPRTP